MRFLKTHMMFCVLMVFALLAVNAPVSAMAGKIIGPPNVYQLVTSVANRIEYLRWYMGRPKMTQQPPKVSNVTPHEVYFQAVTLFEKANRLSFEITLDDVSSPLPPMGEIEPKDVYRVVKDAQRRIVHIEHLLGIENRDEFPELDTSRTPTDVFVAVVQLNRQLNLMIDKRFTPSDVFRQVTVALSYTDRFLAVLPNPPPPPQKPTPVVPGKRPLDVYRRILTSYELVTQIGAKFNRPTVQLDLWAANEADVRPSDVFDIASLLVSELADVHKEMIGAEAPRKVRWERGKFPSDVYQRVGVLEQQLKEVLVRLK